LSSAKDGRQTVHFFTMPSVAGGGAFHTAYFHATQQALLEEPGSANTYLPFAVGPFTARPINDQEDELCFLGRDGAVPITASELFNGI
jgi:hypothetical protein